MQVGDTVNLTDDAKRWIRTYREKDLPANVDLDLPFTIVEWEPAMDLGLVIDQAGRKFIMDCDDVVPR